MNYIKNRIIPYNYLMGTNYPIGSNRWTGVIISKYIIEKWFDIYYSMLDTFINNDFFSGKEQNILNNIYIKYGDSLLNLVEPTNYNLDKWFYLLYYITN